MFGIKQIGNLICGLLTFKETCAAINTQPKAVKRLTQHCLPTLKLKTYKSWCKFICICYLPSGLNGKQNPNLYKDFSGEKT